MQQIDIGRALDQGGWHGYHKLVLVFAAAAFLVDGLANQVLGLSIPAMMHAWHLPRAAFASVAALGLIGVAGGTVAGGLLGDRLGRRWALIASVLLFGGMTAAAAAARNVHGLAWLRLLAGLGLGGAVPNATALIAEFTPQRRRSMAIALGMVFIPIGGLVASACATVVLPRAGWRALFLIGGLVPLALAALLMPMLPESPRFLLRCPARRAELLRLLARLHAAPPPGADLLDGADRHGAARFSALFGRFRRQDTFALWGGFFFWLLASYSFFSWGPAMLAGRGWNLRQTSAALTSFNTGGMIGSLVGGWSIERWGSRRSVPVLAGCGCSVALCLAAARFDATHGVVLVIAALGMEGLFVSGVQNGLYASAAHVYPAAARATGVGAAAGVGRLGAVASSYVGIFALGMGGGHGYFLAIAAEMAATLLCLLLVVHPIARNPVSRDAG